MDTQQHHEAQDSIGEWAESHPIVRRPYIPLGCDQQGRVVDGIRLYPAEACSDFGMDEDQSDGADWEVLWWLGRGLRVAAGFVLLAYFVVQIGGAALEYFLSHG